MKKFAGWSLSILIPFVLTAAAVSAQGTVPQEAQDQVKKAVAVIESAKQPSDYAAAVEAFEAAIRLAPAWADVHYNLARVLAEINKPVRAVKEYRRYLELSPGAGDRGKVEETIGRLQEMKAAQRKIGMAWISFGEMPDGIYILHVIPGSPVERGSLRRGDKITAVNGKPVGGVSLVEFFRILEDGLSAHTTSTMRMSARGGAMLDPRDWVAFSMIRAGQEMSLTVRKSAFISKSYEIEDEEFEGEVLQSSLPVFVTFWAKRCPPCQKTTPVVESLSQKYGDRVKFVTISVEDNRAAAARLEVKGIPTMILFRDGKPVERFMGLQPAEKIEGLVKMGL